MKMFKPRPLFVKHRVPTGFVMPKAVARKPPKEQPPLPLNDEMELEGRAHFAKAALQNMRAKLEDL